VDDGARELARDEVAGVGIGAIGVDFARHAQAEFLPRLLQREPRHHHKDVSGIDRFHRARDGPREVDVLVGDVAERAVRLDVAEPPARRVGERRERADLVDDLLLDVRRPLAEDRPPAEPPEIEEARMGAGADARRGGGGERPRHHQRVAGVEAAGDVGRRHDLEHRLVVADLVDAEALAHVTVEIDRCHASSVARGDAVPVMPTRRR
jgi:hypothetical protein